MNNNSGDIRRKFRLRWRNCEGEIIDMYILGPEIYNLTVSNRVNLWFQIFQGRNNMEVPPPWPPCALSAVSAFILSPNTHHRSSSCVSALRLAAPPPCAISSLQRGWIPPGKCFRSRELGLAPSVSPAALGLSSQAGDLATPLCRRHHLPNVLLSCASASGLKS